MYTLDEVIGKMNRDGRRVTYGHVASLPGINKRPQNLMCGRDRKKENSWVVASTTNKTRGSRKGFPTGYTENEIDSRLSNSPEPFKTMDEFMKWLEGQEDLE